LVSKVPQSVSTELTASLAMCFVIKIVSALHWFSSAQYRQELTSQRTSLAMEFHLAFDTEKTTQSGEVAACPEGYLF
jgi:hypothetical protein